MLRYIGCDKYEFVTENNKTVVLTRNDIDTICNLASENENFDINKQMILLAEKSLHWQELYDELKQDRNILYDDIIELIRKHKITAED